MKKHEKYDNKLISKQQHNIREYYVLYCFTMKWCIKNKLLKNNTDTKNQQNHHHPDQKEAALNAKAMELIVNLWMFCLLFLRLWHSFLKSLKLSFQFFFNAIFKLFSTIFNANEKKKKPQRRLSISLASVLFNANITWFFFLFVCSNVV